MSVPGGLPVARPPRPTGLPGWVAVAVVLGLVGAATLAVHDSLAVARLIDDRAWLDVALQYVDGVTPSLVVTAVGAAGAVVGLMLVVASLWPRRTKYWRLAGTGGAYVHRRAIERLGAAAAADGVGVVGARARLRRRLVIRVETTGGRQVADEAAARVAVVVDALEPRPRVVVHQRRRSSAARGGFR